MWQVALGEGTETEVLYDASVMEEIRALQTVVKSFTFNLVCSLPPPLLAPLFLLEFTLPFFLFLFFFTQRAQLSELEELFFSMTKANRDTLEYIGVFSAKLELDFCKNNGDEGVILFQMANLFAPYLIRPSVWTTSSPQEKKVAKFLQQRFILLFFLFLKKKHNLLTKLERMEIDRSDDEILENMVTCCSPLLWLFLSQWLLWVFDSSRPTYRAPQWLVSSLTRPIFPPLTHESPSLGVSLPSLEEPCRSSRRFPRSPDQICLSRPLPPPQSRRVGSSKRPCWIN